MGIGPTVGVVKLMERWVGEGGGIGACPDRIGGLIMTVTKQAKWNMNLLVMLVVPLNKKLELVNL